MARTGGGGSGSRGGDNNEERLRKMVADHDALPSPGVNPLKGSPKCSCRKLGLGRRSRLPAL